MTHTPAMGLRIRDVEAEGAVLPCKIGTKGRSRGWQQNSCGENGIVATWR